MSIVVNCSCGKRFKAKDEMAGKAVRCPGCKEPLRIPGGQGGPAPGAGVTEKKKGVKPKIDTVGVLERYEEAQREKQMSAETDAAYRMEQQKILESYDQMSGRGGPDAKGKLKGAKVGEKPKKLTFVSKLSDACGVICGTLLFKYLVIAALVCGGVLGSVYAVKYATSYMGEATQPGKSRDERIEDLFVKAEAALEAKRWGEVRDALAALLREQPRLEKHRRYKKIKQELEARFGGG